MSSFKVFLFINEDLSCFINFACNIQTEKSDKEQNALDAISDRSRNDFVNVKFMLVNRRSHSRRGFYLLHRTNVQRKHRAGAP